MITLYIHEIIRLYCVSWLFTSDSVLGSQSLSDIFNTVPCVQNIGLTGLLINSNIFVVYDRFCALDNYIVVMIRLLAHMLNISYKTKVKYIKVLLILTNFNNI